ncbi:MAG: formylglycine-generating enzyme family protein [Lewinellaceae bacterium]|nr:formylglycine-generating enzyme family protein [Lewinellaceae bacterium]
MMKTYPLLALLSISFLQCINVHQSAGPATAEEIADLAVAPPAKYDPEFQFEYPMVTVQGGIFTMGCTNKKRGYDTDECPHPDTVDTFRMGIYEVTKYQWIQVMGNNPGAFADCFDCPANYISWIDAQKFIKKLNAVTGRRYRLPTEAEWEYAARGGAAGAVKNTLYAGGNRLDKVAWYNDNSDKKLHPVGQKAPNALGIYDLCGNIREWCEDHYVEYPGCPIPPSLSSIRCCRGGSWSSSYFACRISEHLRMEPSGRYLNMGFRLVDD